MARLTKKQFEDVFREEILPHVVDRYEQDGVPDKPARREAWNDTVDAYIRDRMLPGAAGNWSHPRWLETWRPPPRRHHATKKPSAQIAREIDRRLRDAGERPLTEIRAGDRVTIVDRFGKERTGRAVMRGPYGWVLNMGGRHGTPGIATDANVIAVRCGKK